MQQTQLMTTELGTTGLQITRVGFGAWAIGGGGWEFGWGPQEDGESIAAIERALELGVNWIDTAAAYGFGRSEEVVGRAIAGLAERPYVFTKASLVEGPGRRVVHSLKRDSILREAEASLERLGVETIDLYQIHWPLPEQDLDEGWSTLAELKEQGLVATSASPTSTSPAGADPADRAGRDAPAALLARRSRRRAGGPAVRRACWNRRDRLLADGLRASDRRG